MRTTAVHLTKKLHQMPSGQSGEVWSVEDKLRLGVNLADWDRLGCLLQRVEMKPVGGCRLEINPQLVAETITYLGEELAVIEKEEGRGKAVLRSVHPRTEEGRISFFEMLLDAAEGMSLARYVYDRTRGERSAIPASMARETLDRLLKDLIALGGGQIKEGPEEF